MTDSRFPVACPRCNAPVGQPCVSCMGNATITHVSRWNAAHAAGLPMGSPDQRELRELNKRRETFDAAKHLNLNEET